MSKQSEAKERQNYRDPKKGGKCATCRHFKCLEIHNHWGQTFRKNCRCLLGGFAVKQSYVCDAFTTK